MKYYLLILLLSFPAGVYAQISYTSTDGQGRRGHHVSRGEYNSIAVYLDKSEVPEGAKRIGIISAQFKDEATALTEAKKVAAKYGGDAIWVVKAIEGTNAERGHKHKQRYGYWVYELREEQQH